MTREVDYAETVGLLQRAVAEKGADYIYEIPDGSFCVYYNREGNPSCIVGHVFSYLEIPPMEYDYTYNSSSINTVVLSDLSEFVSFTPKAERLLTRAQFNQDLGNPWGEAVHAAIKATKVERSNDE